MRSLPTRARACSVDLMSFKLLLGRARPKEHAWSARRSLEKYIMNGLVKDSGD